MAAPDIPHPARAPQRPQNSAESHHDDFGVEEDLDTDSAASLVVVLAASLAGLSAALSAKRRVGTNVVLVVWEDRGRREGDAKRVARKTIGRKDAMVVVL
jgi:hypothetical protein